MKRFYSLAAALMTALAVTAASDSFAQTRATGSTSRSSSTQTTRSSSSTTSRSSSSSTKQSGTTTRSSSGSSTRQSGTTTRSTSGTTTRQSGTTSRSTSGTTTRQSGTTSRSTSGTTTRQSGTTTRQSGTTTRQSGTTTRQSGTTTRQSGTTTRQSGTTSRSTSGSTTTRQSGTTTRATGGTTSTATTRATQSGTAVRSTGSTQTPASTSTVRVNSNITRSGLGNTESQSSHKENYRDNGGNYRYGDDNFRMDGDRNLARTAPRHRDFLGYDRPGHFWGDVPHYYGYRINYLPPRYRRVRHWGIDYYIYNNIYYRYYGGVYYVSRPPFGIRVAMALDRAYLNAVRFSYYTNAYRAFSYHFDYYETIAEQNRLIAQQNMLIAQQNANYAMNSNRAMSAYELANRLNLVQSYAYANSNYFYQDGVFYLYQNGQYTTIIPPAGALVTSLPDDYETIVLNGVEYYMVDNTVYRTMLFDSQPYLEVLGQMYGSMYNQYNYYR